MPVPKLRLQTIRPNENRADARAFADQRSSPSQATEAGEPCKSARPIERPGYKPWRRRSQKPVDEPSNPLFQKDLYRVPGWSILLFLTAAAAIVVPAVWLLPEKTMLPMLTAFFGAGLVASAIAVLPLGPRAGLQALGFRAVGWRPIVLGVVVTTLLSFAVSQLGIQPEGVKQVTAQVRDPAVLVPTLLVLAILAPLVEELVFRGLLYGWVAGRWGGLAAFLVSSVAFAAAHAEPAHIFLVAPLGLWFGWLRWRTGSLVPSIAAHMINNGIAVAGAAFLGGS
ncbi:MAG: CPBP family intramembrane metalloprotease [Reyranella sp.]|nr:MAG: CPBP family intramembrane metalloprotease [Reyranella sp.]